MQQNKIFKMTAVWLFMLMFTIGPMMIYANTSQDPGLYLRILGDGEFLSHVTGEKYTTTSTPVYGSFYLELAQDKNVSTLSKITLYENGKAIGTFTPQVYNRSWDDVGYYKKWIYHVLVKPAFGKTVEYYFKADDGGGFESNRIVVKMPELKTQVLPMGDKDDFKVTGTSSKYYNKSFVVVDPGKNPVASYQLVTTDTGIGVKIGDSIKPACIHYFGYIPTGAWNINEALKSHTNCPAENYAIIVSTHEGNQGFDNYYSDKTSSSANTLSNFPEALGVSNATAEMQAVYLGTPTDSGKKIRVFLGTYASFGSPESCGCPYQCDYSPVVAEIKELSDMLSVMTKSNMPKLKLGTGFLDIYQEYHETILSHTGKLIGPYSEAHILAANGRGKTTGSMFLKVIDEQELFNKLGITTENQFQQILMNNSNRVKDILTNSKWPEGFIIDYFNINLNSYIPVPDIPVEDGCCNCSIVLADFVQKAIQAGGEQHLTSPNLKTYLVQSILNKLSNGNSPFEKALAKLELTHLLKVYAPQLNESQRHALVQTPSETSIKQVLTLSESGTQGVKDILTKLGIEGIADKTLAQIKEQLAHEHTLIEESTNTYEKTLNLVRQVLEAKGKDIAYYQNKSIHITVTVNEKDKKRPSEKMFNVLLKIEDETIEYNPPEDKDSYDTLFQWFGEPVPNNNGNGRVKQMLTNYHFGKQGGNVFIRSIIPGKRVYDPRPCTCGYICSYPAVSDTMMLDGIPIKVNWANKLVQECVCRYMQLKGDSKPLEIQVIKTSNMSIKSNFIAPEGISNLQFVVSYSNPLSEGEKDEIIGTIKVTYRNEVPQMPKLLLDESHDALIYIRDKTNLNKVAQYTQPIAKGGDTLEIILSTLDLYPDKEYLVDIYFNMMFEGGYKYQDYLNYIRNLSITDPEQVGKPVVDIIISSAADPEISQYLSYRLNYAELYKIK